MASSNPILFVVQLDRDLHNGETGNTLAGLFDPLLRHVRIHTLDHLLFENSAFVIFEISCMSDDCRGRFYSDGRLLNV